jgi:cytochrome c oxidase assembly factor CtaG
MLLEDWQLAIESILAEWSLPPLLTIAVVLTACAYLRGWLAIRKTRAAQFTVLRLNCFLLGLAVLWLAVASPLDDFADALLSAHMVQHLLLMSVVPPLLLLGWPVVPLLRGMPAWILKPVLGPLLRLAVLRRLGRWLISPPVAWIAMNLTFLGWHIPAAYDFALQHEYWHDFEHVCFLASSSAFWWCVIQPWPTQSRRKSWGLLVYLLSADLVNTALSAFLAFCDWPVYSYYLTQPNPFHVSPLSDQILGAVIMWVAGSFVFLAPATWITFSLLQAPSTRMA